MPQRSVRSRAIDHIARWSRLRSQLTIDRPRREPFWFHLSIFSLFVVVTLLPAFVIQSADFPGAN